ncbi:hypothetical protein BDW75DRAFT_230551 [Aspergillus navahoensis]
MSTRRGQSSRHLPAIAPKDEVTPLSRHGSSPTAARATTIQPRLRFPPRSRTGCWYVLLRGAPSELFKCDEVHPQCNQCARLGHVCDYQPRLCFRDDTRRVMERMPDVKTKGNVVWDPAKTSPRQGHITTSGSIPYDLLPDFSRLTSDEDREKKAQGSAPGTYHVIVVPESFARLPEYTDDALETMPSNPYSSPLSEYSSYDPMDDVTMSEDPNVVFLNQFRDPRKQVYPSRRSYTQSPESDLGSTSAPATMMYTPLQDISEDQISESVNLETYGMALLDHFQNAVWMQLIPGGHGYLEANIFEQEASNFPLLLHMMMAVSALSLVHQGNAHYMDALQYYDHALPSFQSSLQNCDDVLSDGLFVTHFLLLIYRIALTTPSNGSNLWSHHMFRLLQLGAGPGEYIRAAIESHLLPAAESLIYPAGVKDNKVEYPGERVTQPLVMSLYRKCFQLAARLGLLATSFKIASFSCSILRHEQGNNVGLSSKGRFSTIRRRPSIPRFPLFLSGAVTTSKETNMAAWELLAELRETDPGYQAVATSSILQAVYEAQLLHSRSGGFMREVDWTEVAVNHRFRLVGYG